MIYGHYPNTERCFLPITSPRLGFLGSLAVWVAALGYFVDLFDLMLFGVVRVQSLKDLGLNDAEVFRHGISLMNWQMAGVLLGGFLFGVLGDRMGRMKSLFLSIALYSFGNFLNAFVQNIDQYIAIRFITGVGLAGELGVGLTLASEAVGKLQRGWATTFIGAIGLSGTLGAVTVSRFLDWRTCFLVGGAMGLGLLVLRFWVHESELYLLRKNQNALRSLENPSLDVPRRHSESPKVRWGDIRLIFSSSSSLTRFLGLIGVALPIWVTIGMYVTFAPEFGVALGLAEPVTAANSLQFSAIGVVLGDILYGAISQVWKSRKKALALALFVLALSVTILFAFGNGWSANFYYGYTFVLGVATGYWAVFMALTVEQFGTNVRSTVATSVPNLARAAVIPFNLLLQTLSHQFGLYSAAIAVAVLAFGIAGWSWYQLQETFGVDLDFIEKES